MELKARKDEFDIAKAVAIWMVVVGHLYSSVQNDTIAFIQFSHMPIFFFISGYFLWKSTQKYTLLEICLKKTKSLLVPYFVWSMFSFIANITLMLMKNAGGGGYILDEFFGIFLYSRSVWFLIELYFCSILFVVLQTTAQRHKVNCYLILVTTWIVLSFLLPDELFALYKFKWLFPFMLAGAFCAEKLQVCKNNFRGEIVSLILFLILSYIFYDNTFFKKYSTFSYHSWREIAVGVLYYGISSLGIVGVYALTHWKKPTLLRRLVCAIGQSSMDIYVIHMFLIKFIVWKPSFSNTYFLYAYVVIYSSGIILLILLLRYKVLKCWLYDILIGRF